MRSPRVSQVWFVGLAAASTVLVLGCYATLSPEPGAPVSLTSEEVVYAAPPPNVEAYPVVVYGGAPNYYVEGRWYRQTPRGWGYYRQEPAHLAQHRPRARPQEHPQQRHEEREDRHERGR